MTKIFCQCLRSLKLACFVCKIPPLIFISIIAGGIYFLCSYLRVLLTIFNIALWHETNFKKNVYFRHLQTETMGYEAMQYSTNTAWGSSENFVLIIQERLPGVVKWASSGKKTKKSVFVLYPVLLDLIWPATVVATQCKCKAWPMFVTYL